MDNPSLLLFNCHDNLHAKIDCVKCPTDTRKVLSESGVIIDSMSMLPVFLHRPLSEICSLVEKLKYRDALATKSVQIHSPPAKPNCTAWLGGEQRKARPRL